MNTLFVIFLLGFFYYLFFHPLTTLEELHRVFDPIYFEHREDNDDHPYI